MQSYQTVDMSQYRQQQQLLKQPITQIPSNPLLQHHHPQHQTLETELSANTNDNNVEAVNEHGQNISEEQPDNNDNIINMYTRNLVENRNQGNKYRVVKILLDLGVFGYLVGRFFYNYQLPIFAKIFIFKYIFHNWRAKYQNQVNRTFITFMSLWPLFKLFHYGYSSINQEQTLFILLYSIQLVPNLCGLAFTCCIVSCTCFCTTCCFCCCAFDQIRKSVLKCFESYKYRKVKQQICCHNIQTIQGKQCSICLSEGNKMVSLKCGHLFHPSCLRTWIDQHRTCPNCRAILY